MVEMMDYFETRGQTLDMFDLSSISNYMENNFVSKISFDGVPILPPVMTTKRREEMLAYKRQAQIAETRLRARKREKIAKRARTLVKDIKDTRAMRQGVPSSPDTAGPCQSVGELEPPGRDRRLPGADSNPVDESSTTVNSSYKHSNSRASPLDGCLAQSEKGSLRLDQVRSSGEGRNSPFLLDSMSDIPSLEDTATSLPTEYGGMALTSTKQQQISQVLAKLSKALNIQDSLTSTSSSAVSEELNHTVVNVDESSQSLSTCMASADSTVGSTLGNSVSLPFAETSAGMSSHDTSQDTVLEFTATGETMAGYIEGASLESASSNSTPKIGPPSNDSRNSDSNTSVQSPPDMASKASPKSPKNTVHFASTVMEIYTDNQSGKSSTLVKSLQSSGGTPRSSEVYGPELTEMLLKQLKARKDGSQHIEKSKGYTDVLKDLSVSDSAQSYSSIETDQSVSLLSKVVLSPDGDSSCSSTKEMQPQNGRIPFQSYATEGETSDKENEFASKSMAVSSSNSHILTAEPSKAGPRGNCNSKNNIVTGLNISRDPSPSEQSGKHTLEYSTASRSTNTTGRESSLSRVSLQSMSSTSVDTGTLTGRMSSASVDTGTLTGRMSSASVDTGTLTGSANTHSLTQSRDVRESSATISSSLTIGDEVSESYVMSRQNTDQAVQSKTAKQNMQMEVKELNIPVCDAERTENLQIAEQKDVTDSGNPKKKHARKGSYTLDEPSPALIRACSKQSVLEAEESPVSNVVSDAELQTRIGISGSLIASADQPVQRKLEYDELEEDPVQTSPETQVERDAEIQGKQEHLDRYLDCVQQQSVDSSQSGMSVDGLTATAVPPPVEQRPEAGMEFLDSFNLSSLASFSFDYNRINRMSQEEIVDMQSSHFDKLRKHLIEQQKQQLEHLFHQQQHEQVLLQKEIEERSRMLNEQQEFLQCQSSLSGPVLKNQLSLPKVQNTSPSTSITHTAAVPVPDQAETSPRQRAQRSSPYNYVSSPSLVKHPSDHDSSMVSTFSRTTPKQYLFGNSSPTLSAAHNVNIPHNKPVLRSPRRAEPELVRNRKLVIPDKAYESSMKPYFDRVSAVVKGYLTRRLLRTEKVQNFIKIIRDTRSFALNFQSETPIKRGNFSMQDQDLLERIIAQLQAALLDVHEVFFEISVSERMAMIAHSRHVEVERHYKEMEQGHSVDRSHPRVSTATLKAIERKKRAQAAEASVFGTSRPRSAPPPETSSPRQARSMDLRALRPLQGQISPIRPVRDDLSTSRDKSRPHTAPDRTAATNNTQLPGKGKKSNIGPTERRRPSKSVLVKARPNISGATGGKSTSTAAAKTKSDKAWR